MILITQLISNIAYYVGTSCTAIATSIGISAENASSFGSFVNSAISWLDPFAKTQDFRLGIFSVSALIFLVSIGILFLYMTYRVLEKKRWSQA